jgi:hypothetical protein
MLNLLPSRTAIDSPSFYPNEGLHSRRFFNVLKLGDIFMLDQDIAIQAFGISGNEYSFLASPIGTYFEPIAGVYEFIKMAINGKWDVVYIGQTDNFNRRLYTELEQHQAWSCIKRNGATHIAIFPVYGIEQNRLDIETDLRKKYSLSPCNHQ